MPSFRRPSSWRSLLWFAPLIPLILYPLTGHVTAGVAATLPFAALYTAQALQRETIFNGLMLEGLRAWGRWRAALVVALLQGLLTASVFALVPPEDGFLPLLLLLSANTVGQSFAAAALRQRTRLLWPLILAEVAGGVTYYITLSPHPSPYPLTTYRVAFHLSEAAYGLLLGAVALLSMRGGDTAERMVGEAAAPPGVATVGTREVPTPGSQARRGTSARMGLSCLGLLVGMGILVLAAVDSSGASPGGSSPRMQEASARAYSAAAPGRSCDHGGAQWVEDPKEGYACRDGGLLITQQYFEYQAEAYFAFAGEGRGEDQFVPHAYRVEVRADIVSGKPGTCVGLHVHIQDFQGRQTLFACSDGTWTIGRCDLHCERDVDLLSGSLLGPEQHFLLAVDVTDTAMTFWVNGAQVATLQDATYKSTNQLALALYGPEDPQAPPSALFRDIRYIPRS